MEAIYSEPREAQVAVQEIAVLLDLLADRLEAIASGLAQPPELDAMLNDELPMTVAVDLRGAIECTLLDDLRPAAQRLGRAARATEESLRQEFRKKLPGSPIA
jgi:hypothetical protein